jgi:catechol 2,3-dioxygenase-like lactoylglutathione lyase family enzyme
MHHLDLTVRDLARSRPFYELVLEFLGYRCVKDTDQVVVWDLALPDGVCGLAIRPAARHRDHDRYTVGLHHFAWNADSRQDVDRLHDRLAAAGATILDAPAEYPQYGTGYYAVFFADPDGLKLELCHYPGEELTRAGSRPSSSA